MVLYLIALNYFVFYIVLY